jgi:hypothetical protein
MTRGACRLLEHLKRQYCRTKHTCWPSRGRLARELHRDERTIYRWLKELVEKELITSDQRGHNSALLSLNVECFQRDWLLNVRAVRAVRAAPLYEISIRKEKLASKPSPKKTPDYEAELTAELERLRVRLRPDWKTVDQAIESGLPAGVAAAILGPLVLNRALSARIRRADNPEAYWFAVVAEELSKVARKPPQSESGLSLVAGVGR